PPPPPTAGPTPPPTPTPVTVGNYFCLSVAQAREQITNSNLTVGVIWPNDEIERYEEDWFVHIQDPVAGSQVPPGTAVHLFVRSPDSPGC
ncbi:MAG TPA: PASTA domain-containing protein, partial [Candidatus Limnocylindrales bacterium]|nr:PASTA domain-containing protein [Candidatus Limnocylindrales bacterium]